MPLERCQRVGIGKIGKKMWEWGVGHDVVGNWKLKIGMATLGYDWIMALSGEGDYHCTKGQYAYLHHGRVECLLF